MNTLEIKNLKKIYKNGFEAFKGIDLDFHFAHAVEADHFQITAIIKCIAPYGAHGLRYIQLGQASGLKGILTNVCAFAAIIKNYTGQFATETKGILANR